MAGAVERLVHEALGVAGYAVLRSRRPRSLPPPEVRYVTTILRLPEALTAQVEPVLARLHELEPRHCYYRRDQLHVTLANLDGLRVPLERVEDMIAAAPPLRFAARGLGLSPGTLLLRAEPLDGAFVSLRRSLRALGDAPPGLRAAVVRPLLGQIAFANVARFSGLVSPAFLREVRRLRRLELGSWTATEVEVVETDRLLSPGATRVLGRIPLG